MFQPYIQNELQLLDINTKVIHKNTKNTDIIMKYCRVIFSVKINLQFKFSKESCLLNFTNFLFKQYLFLFFIKIHYSLSFTKLHKC